MSKAELCRNYYARLASVQNSCNCGCTSYSASVEQSLKFSNGVIKFMMLGGLAATTISSVRNLASLFMMNRTTQGRSIGSANSIFTYNNDKNTDYSTQAVNEIQQEIKNVDKEINDTTKLKTDLKIDNLENDLTTATAKVKTTKAALYAADTAYNAAKADPNTSVSDRTSLEHTCEKANDDYKKALDDEAKAKSALETATAKAEEYDGKLTELNTKKANLKTELDKCKILDKANGDNSFDRSSTKKATGKNLENQAFELKNARQLINKFSQAKSLYEKEPTEENKARLEQAKENFIKEYESGDSTNNLSLKEAYNVIKDYQI